MPVNQTLAQFSDWAYFTAFAMYSVALIVSIAFYVRRQFAIEAKQESKEKVLVGVGAGAAGADAPGAEISEDSAKAATDSEAAVTDDQVAAKFAGANKLGTIAEMFVYVGIAVHFASVLLRGLSAGRFPWGNLYEYVTVFSLFAMVIAAAVLRRDSMRVFWPWLLTPVIALLFFGGTKLYAESAPVVPALQSFWFPIHVSTVSIGGGLTLVSGVASLLYLLRMKFPAGTEKGFWGGVARPLPSVKTLDMIAYRIAIWALPIFGLGIVFGAIWAEAAWGRFWNWDPKETFSLISWVFYAVYLHARATSGWRNQAAAIINIAGFATMVFNLFFVNMVVSGLHSYAGLN